MTRTRQPLEVKTDAKPSDEMKKFSTHSFGAQFAEVRVNEDTGEVRVARWVGAFGVGNRLNEKTATSQLKGGIIFGIGMALMEHTVVDDRDARIVNPNLAEYHVPVNADVPDIECDLRANEHDDIINPLDTLLKARGRNRHRWARLGEQAIAGGERGSPSGFARRAVPVF